MGQATRFHFLEGAGIFSLHHYVKTSSGAHPPSSPVGMGALGLGSDTDHSPLSRAMVKNAWSYTSCPQYVFMA